MNSHPNISPKNTLYFVRHGQSIANLEGLYSSPESPLTDLGREQAKQMGVRLQSKNITQIVTSPDIRAQETASIIAQQIGHSKADIVTINELHERRFGSLTGTPRRPEQYFAYTFIAEGNAETRQQLLVRMQRAIQKLKAIITGSGNTLVVGHTVSGYFLRELLAGHNTYEDFGSDYQTAHNTIVEIPTSLLRKTT